MSKSRAKRLNENLPNPIIFYSVLIFVCLFMLIAPYSKGLFNGYNVNFEGSIYTAVVWTSLALIPVAIYIFRHANMTSHRDILGLLIWLIPLTTLISTFNAASTHYAINEVYIRFMWAVFFMIGAYFTSHKLGNKIIQYGLMGSGYILVIYGFMNWFGNVSYQDALIQGNRLSNVFQYPNTYAAYLIAILIGSLILITTARSWKWRIAPALMLVPITLSFLLTLSRGALLVFPVIVLLYLVFIPWYRQLIILLYLGMAGGISLLLFSTMTSIRTQLDQGFSTLESVKGWAILLASSLILYAIVEYIERYILPRMKVRWEQWSIFKWTNFILPLAFIVAAVSAYLVILNSPAIVDQLPNQIKSRIEALNAENSSVSLRNAFYKDSMKIIQDYLIFGAGGGAWSVLYESYKSYPYTSTQAHNFIMQYLTETGAAGLLILLGIILYSLFIFIRQAIISRRSSSWDMNRLLFPLYCLSIFIHSMLDFDMSFVFLSCTVFLTLGASVSMDVPLTKVSKKSSSQGWKMGGMVVLSGFALVVFILSSMALNAHTKFKEAVYLATYSGDYNAIKKPLDTAILMSFKHPVYSDLKVGILNQLYLQTREDRYYQESIDLINRVAEKEPFNLQIIWKKNDLLMINDNLVLSNKMLEKELDRFPWELGIYEKLIQNHLELALRDTDSQVRKSHFQEAIKIYKQLESRVQYVKTLSYAARAASSNFKITPSIGLSIGQIYFYEADFTLSSNVLRSVLTIDLDDSFNRTVARWYLASLEKQNLKNKDLYNRLIEKDPLEAEEIRKIVSLKTN